MLKSCTVVTNNFDMMKPFLFSHAVFKNKFINTCTLCKNISVSCSW